MNFLVWNLCSVARIQRFFRLWCERYKVKWTVSENRRCLGCEQCETCTVFISGTQTDVQLMQRISLSISLFQSISLSVCVRVLQSGVVHRLHRFQDNHLNILSFDFTFSVYLLLHISFFCYYWSNVHVRQCRERYTIYSRMYCSIVRLNKQTKFTHLLTTFGPKDKKSQCFSIILHHYGKKKKKNPVCTPHS